MIGERAFQNTLLAESSQLDQVFQRMGDGLRADQTGTGTAQLMLGLIALVAMILFGWVLLRAASPQTFANSPRWLFLGLCRAHRLAGPRRGSSGAWRGHGISTSPQDCSSSRNGSSPAIFPSLCDLGPSNYARCARGCSSGWAHNKARQRKAAGWRYLGSCLPNAGGYRALTLALSQRERGTCEGRLFTAVFPWSRSASSALPGGQRATADFAGRLALLVDVARRFLLRTLRSTGAELIGIGARAIGRHAALRPIADLVEEVGHGD